jgi:hypothetical protein
MPSLYIQSDIGTLDVLTERAFDHIEKRPDKRRPDVVATGTLACPTCDAPVAPVGAMRLDATIECPVCARLGRVREFLSLRQPTRAAHVVVRLRLPA